MSFLTLRGDRNCASFPGLTMVKPAGFLKSEAIFAISLLLPTPTLHVRFSFCKTASLIFSASFDDEDSKLASESGPSTAACCCCCFSRYSD